MATANVSVSFECADQADAQSKLEGWKLHEGCKVFMNVTEMGIPREADSTGKPVPAPEPELPIPTELTPTQVETQELTATNG